MINLFTKAAFAALISLGAIGASSASANAGGVDVDVYIGTPPSHHDGGHRRYIYRPEYREVYPEYREVYRPRYREVYRQEYRPVVVVRPYAGRCNIGRALEKATWRGIHRARVTTVGPNRVVVEGRRGRYWDRMVFANVRGCPIIRR